MTRLILASVVALLAVALVGVAFAANGTLNGSVGPGYTIGLSDASGLAVSHVDAGTYDLAVDDLGIEHNFHLLGPGVDVATEVEDVGKKTFTVTLVDGTYSLVCDPHSDRMRKTLTVGTVTGGGGGTGGGGTGGGGTVTPRPSAPVGSKLLLTSGPGFAITLKTTAGKKVTRLKPGAYTVLARDRSAIHNARLRGAGVSKTTGVGFVGTQTWKIVLKKGKLVFQCDPHAGTMRGSVIVAP